ncbi:MAG: SDR family NAD(P)-dependent oxidoreductase, partial [Rhodanobacteraceae bacterium]
MNEKRALVTGGSGDIGEAICRALAREGWRVIVHAHAHRERADAVANEIRNAHGAAEIATFDLTDAAATGTALDDLLQAGPVHALIHNAGIHDDAPLAGMTGEQWR